MGALDGTRVMVGSDEMPVTALLLPLLPVGPRVDPSDGINDDTFDTGSGVGVDVDGTVGAIDALITSPSAVAETPKRTASDKTPRSLYLFIYST